MCNQVIIVTDTKQKHQPRFANSPLLLQHVYDEPVDPTTFDQVPHHASKMPGGMQQLVFSVLLQVLVGGSVYLRDRAQKQTYKSSSDWRTNPPSPCLGCLSSSWGSGQNKQWNAILPWCILQSLVQTGPDTSSGHVHGGPGKTPAEKETFIYVKDCKDSNKQKRDYLILLPGILSWDNE